jgi:hypothetical protein
MYVHYQCFLIEKTQTHDWKHVPSRALVVEALVNSPSDL